MHRRGIDVDDINSKKYISFFSDKIFFFFTVHVDRINKCQKFFSGSMMFFSDLITFQSYNIIEFMDSIWCIFGFVNIKSIKRKSLFIKQKIFFFLNCPLSPWRNIEHPSGIYLILDILQYLTTENIEIKLNNPGSPVIFRGKDEPVYTYLVMPIKS